MPESTPSALAQRRARLAWWLLAPTLLVLLVLAVLPLAETVGYSVTDARFGSERAVHFVGWRNYTELLMDRRFRASVGITLSFALITVTVELVLGLLVALTINGRFAGRGLVRAVMLVPWAIPTAVSAQMWKWMYHDVYGVINDLLLRMGLLAEPVAWISDPGTVLASVCLVDIWKATPFVTLLLLAGLQLIPPDVYEAARVDGANAWQQFRHLTVPLLMPVIVVTLIFRSLDALRVFDVFYVMVGKRPGFQTLAVYNQQLLMDFARIGEGSAASVILFALIAGVVVAYVSVFQTKEA